MDSALKIFIEQNIDEINANMYDAIIKELPYNYDLSQNIYDSFNYLFSIFKECNIKIPDNMIESTFGKLGYDKDNYIIIPLYNIIKGESVSESLNIIDKYIKETINSYYINSSKNKTCLSDIIEQLTNIFDNDNLDFDVFKSPDYTQIKSKTIESPIEVRVGYQLQVDGEYIELRINLRDYDTDIYVYNDYFGFFVPGFGFAYNKKLLESYMKKILSI